MRNLQPELNHNWFKLASWCVRILLEIISIHLVICLQKAARILLEIISIYVVICLQKAANRLNLMAFQPIKFGGWVDPTMAQSAEYEIDMKESFPMISEGTMNSNLSWWKIAWTTVTWLPKLFRLISFLTMSYRTFCICLKLRMCWRELWADDLLFRGGRRLDIRNVR